jgi:hypothetical protein
MQVRVAEEWPGRIGAAGVRRIRLLERLAHGRMVERANVRDRLLACPSREHRQAHANETQDHLA